MVRLGQKQTDVEVELLLPIGLFEKRHYLPSCLLDFSPASDNGNLFVLLLNVVKGMIDFLKRRLPRNSKLRHPSFSFQHRHVVDHSLDFIGIEEDSLNFDGLDPTFDILVGLHDVFLSPFQHKFGLNLERVAFLVDEPLMIVDCHVTCPFDLS